MNIRKFLTVLLAVILLMISAGCADSSLKESKGTITVSILPFSYFVKKIAGPEYQVNVIVPPGASPATYEPPPSVIQSLNRSEVVIFNRYLGFEQAWMKKLTGVNEDIQALYLADNQDLIAAEAHKHGDHVHYSGVDPHFWVSVSSARLISLDIKDFLQEVYPDDKFIFEKNFEALESEIDATLSYVQERLKDVENRTFLIFHPALTYFAREFGLKQVPVELDGKEPGAAWLKELIDMARRDSIMTILVQKEFNRSSAETIAKEIGGSVVNIFPLSDDWPGAIKEIADALAEADK